MNGIGQCPCLNPVPPDIFQVAADYHVLFGGRPGIQDAQNPSWDKMCGTRYLRSTTTHYVNGSVVETQVIDYPKYSPYVKVDAGVLFKPIPLVPDAQIPAIYADYTKLQIMMLLYGFPHQLSEYMSPKHTVYSNTKDLIEFSDPFTHLPATDYHIYMRELSEPLTITDVLNEMDRIYALVPAAQIPSYDVPDDGLSDTPQGTGGLLILGHYGTEVITLWQPGVGMALGDDWLTLLRTDNDPDRDPTLDPTWLDAEWRLYPTQWTHPTAWAPPYQYEFDIQPCTNPYMVRRRSFIWAGRQWRGNYVADKEFDVVVGQPFKIKTRGELFCAETYQGGSCSQIQFSDIVTPLHLEATERGEMVWIRPGNC